MKKNNILHHSFLTGLSAASAYFIFVLILSLFKINPFMRFEFLFLPIYGIAFALGVRRYKKAMLGNIQGWQAISLTILSNFTASILYGFGLIFLFQFLPEIVAIHKIEMLNYYNAVESTIAQNLTAEQIAELKEGINNVTPRDIVFDKMVKTAAVGFPVAMIMALIFRKL